MVIGVVSRFAKASYNGESNDGVVGIVPLAEAAYDTLQKCCIVLSPSAYLNILKDASRAPADATPCQLMEVRSFIVMQATDCFVMHDGCQSHTINATIHCRLLS